MTHGSFLERQGRREQQRVTRLVDALGPHRRITCRGSWLALNHSEGLLAVKPVEISRDLFQVPSWHSQSVPKQVVSSISQGTAKCSPARPGSFPGAVMIALEEQGVALRRVPSRLRKGRNDSQASYSPPVNDSGRSSNHARAAIAFHQTLSCDSRKRHLAELRREQHMLCVRAPPGSTAEGQTPLDRGSPTLSEPAKRPPWGSTSAQTCWWCHTWGRSRGTVRGEPTSFVSCRRRNECQRGDTLGGPVP